MKHKIFALIAAVSFVLVNLPEARAGGHTATVKNNGKDDVTVQYKHAGKSGTQEYTEDVVKPGETKEVPGGVTRVRVIQAGQTAVFQASPYGAPKTPIQVVVSAGGQNQTLIQLGDKVKFDKPTDPHPPKDDKGKKEEKKEEKPKEGEPPIPSVLDDLAPFKASEKDAIARDIHEFPEAEPEGQHDYPA